MFGALLGFGLGLGDFIINEGKNTDNRLNMLWQQEFAEENRDYAQALQQQIFDREDTSYNRTINDMMNSGLSPLAMSQTNGSGSVVSMPSTPNGQMSYTPSNLAGLMRGAQEMMLAREENDRQQALAENTIQFNASQINKMIGDSVRADNQQYIDWQLNNQKIMNDYKLSLWDLALKDKDIMTNDKQKSLQLDLEREIANNNKAHQDALIKLQTQQLQEEKVNKAFNRSLEMNKHLLNQDAFQLQRAKHNDNMKLQNELLEQGYLKILQSIGSDLIKVGR